MGNHYKYKLIIVLLFSNYCIAQNESNGDSITVVDSSSKAIEATSVTITTEVNVIDAKPTAYRMSYYPRNHPAEPYITKLFFPGEKMQVVIPEGILSDDTLGNIARLEPLGGKYDVQYRMFNKGKGDIVLKPFSIRYISDIIKMKIIDSNENAVPSAKIKVTQAGKLLTHAITDSLGYTRVRIPVSRNLEHEVIISIITDGLFPTWTENYFVPNGYSNKTIQLSALELLKGESIYTVNTDLAPFRKGPENGSDVLFFLNNGEQLAISKVAGDRLYGRVRVYLDKQKNYNYFSGWVLSKNVDLK